MLVRAADARRVGVLIATDQQDVAIMAAESAEALFLAKPPFDDIRDAPLRIIVSFGSHVFVCRPDFMARHAYLLAQTLSAHKDALPAPAVAPDGAVPAHRGPTPFSPAKACRMIEDGRTANTFRGACVVETSTPCRPGVCVFGSAFLSLFGPRSPGAHEMIDMERVNGRARRR